MTLATETRPLLPLDRETVERLSLGRGEPEWLKEQRLAALDDSDITFGITGGTGDFENVRGEIHASSTSNAEVFHLLP